MNFDSLGRLEQKRYIVNGLTNGKCFYYFENGKIRLIQEFKNGKKVGSAIKYDSYSRIKQYMLYNFESLIAFKKDYYSNGSKQIKFKQDYLISQYYLQNISNKYLKNHKYGYSVAIPKPPDNKRIVEFLEIDEKNNILKKTVTKDTTGVLNFTFSFNKEGEYKICTKAFLFDKFGKVEWKDSLCHQIKIQ